GFVVTAPHHRLHHAVDPGLHGRNLATLLPVWDRLFGTRARVPAGAVPACGLDDRAPTASLLDALLQPWSAMPRPPGRRMG
ncbi:sterol desaturase family protein, partial [Escherichia coli]|nr:sterol desaturase family protein [Escherichia coli]